MARFKHCQELELPAMHRLAVVLGNITRRELTKPPDVKSGGRFEHFVAVGGLAQIGKQPLAEPIGSNFPVAAL